MEVVVALLVLLLGLPVGRKKQLRSKLLVVQVQVLLITLVEALLVQLLVAEIMVALVISFANIVGAQETLLEMVLEEYLVVPELVE